MVKKTSRRKKAAARVRRARVVPAEQWVRKRVVIDQHKLDEVRDLLGVATDKEALDQALGFVAFYRGVVKGIETISLSGGFTDPFEGT